MAFRFRSPVLTGSNSEREYTAILTALSGINAKLDKILAGEKTFMADLATLQADVTAQTTVEQSAITLLNGLSAAIKQAGTDPVALKAVTDQIESNTSALSAAVAANTPAA